MPVGMAAFPSVIEKPVPVTKMNDPGHLVVFRIHAINLPPSTGICAPVTKDPDSIRKATA